MVRRGYLAVAAVGFWTLNAGCVVCVDGEGGCRWGASVGPTFWTAPVTERLALDAAGMESLITRSHNGSVEFAPCGDGEAPFVEITKKAGGSTLGRADDAMSALEVYVESAGTARHVGYRWKEWKRPDWSAQVSFRIHAPANVKLDVETHNGAITATGAQGSVQLVTHNGAITADSVNGSLFAETHNGRITATYAGGELRLVTHNGPITANLSGCERVSGDVTTHNGRVEVVVGPKTSTRLSARTHSGGLSVRAPLDGARVSGREVVGNIGAGEGRLEVTTHNGGVTITDKAG